MAKITGTAIRDPIMVKCSHDYPTVAGSPTFTYYSARLGCRHQMAHFSEAQRVHPQLEFQESHQLLKAVHWHAWRPFSQALDMIRTDIIAVVRVENGELFFRNVRIDTEFLTLYQSTRDMVRAVYAYIGIIKSMAGIEKMQQPPALVRTERVARAPVQTPVEFLAKVLGR